MVLAICLALGLQWFVLQSVAWTTMLVKYSAQTSITEAFAKTFDGNHPCSLCLAVHKAKGADRKAELQPLASKFNLFIVRASLPFIPVARAIHYFPERGKVCARSDSPPVPPPRFALV